jgi:hypothetical protein
MQVLQIVCIRLPVVLQASADFKLGLDVPLPLKKLNVPEIIRRNWYEGRRGGPHEGTWVGIPKEVDDAHNAEARAVLDRPRKRRRHVDA